MEQKGHKTKILSEKQGISNKRNRKKTLIINIVLLVSGIAVSASGLIIQLHYHLLKKNAGSFVLALNQREWNSVHVWTSVLFLTVAVYHVLAHRKWYKNIFKKKIVPKYKPTLLLTFLMIVVSVSGLLPLLISYCGDNETLRFQVVEVHDKVALLFLFVVFRHTAKRFKWYLNRF